MAKTLKRKAPGLGALRKQLGALPQKALKEESLRHARGWMDEQRQALKRDFLKADDAEALFSRHTDIIDTLITSLYEVCCPKRTPPVAIVAVGGYGRRELFPHSDIDLMFLYDTGQAEEAARIAEFILYLLWDLGLTVGQAHRTVDEAITLAKDDMSIRTTLLDARFLAGQETLFTTFRKRFDKEIVAGSAQAFIEAKLAERDARHQRFGDSRYMLEPNVKEGKGGLRDLHTLWWLARYTYGVESFGDLVERRLLTEEEYQTFEQSRQFLCRVRIHLHFLAGRAEERLTFDRQKALAEAMGFGHSSPNKAIERFMRRYFMAVRTAGVVTRIFCALLEEGKKRKPKRSLAWLGDAPWKLYGFAMDGERLNVRSSYLFENEPIQMLEMFRVAQEHEIDIHPKALQLMGRNLWRIDEGLRNDARANALFLDILLSKKNPEGTLRRMSEAGVLGRFIPDFGRVVGRTQFNMYHVYTVDEHTLVAIGALGAMERGEFIEEAPIASELIKRIKMRRVLYLALFCHDIAKGRGQDHSEMGEKLAMKLAERCGFSQEEIETTGWLVRNHLLFTDTAYKRDLDDPKAIADFVAAVKSSERLKLLLVLTVADIRAVSPGVWNGWKASLLRDLYHRAEQMIGTGEVTIGRQDATRFRKELQQQLPGWSEEEVEEYLEQGSSAFLAHFDPARHAGFARMLRESKAMHLPLLIDTRQDYERSITEIAICTPDQYGLFSKLAGALTLAGANIAYAKIFTLKNGMAIDIFQVQDATGNVFDRADRLAKMSVAIEQALSGQLDLAREFAARKESARPSHDAVRVPAQVFIDNEASNICSVIEISGHDRTGLLYQVTQAMAELGISIINAHVFTYGTQVADVFYVKDIFGMKIGHEHKRREVREAIIAAINNQPPPARASGTEPSAASLP